MTTLKNILVGTDFSECGDDALTFAFALASGLGAKVHLLHCFTLRDMIAAASPDHEQLADADAWAERKLGEVTAPYRSAGLVGELIVTMGQPGPALLATSARLDTDLIMLGARQRRSFTQGLFVDMAERVLRDAPCPVMILRHPTRKADLHRHASWRPSQAASASHPAASSSPPSLSSFGEQTSASVAPFASSGVARCAGANATAPSAGVRRAPIALTRS